jgi:hypothetical protein
VDGLDDFGVIDALQIRRRGPQVAMAEQPKVANHVPRRRDRPISPIAASSAIAVTTLTPGSVISRNASAQLSASAPRILSTCSISPARKST